MPKVNKRGGKLVDPAQAAGVLEKEADGDFGLVQTAVDNIKLENPIIEEGEVTGSLIKILVHKYLKGIKMDNLILGCTHYPIIENIIRDEVGEKVKLINPGVCTSLVVRNYLTENDLLKKSNKKGQLRIFVTDENSRFKKVAELFLGRKLKNNVQKVNL